MIASGGSLALIVMLGMVTGIGGLVVAVSLSKFQLDYIAQHRMKVTDQTVLEPLGADIWTWIKKHPIHVFGSVLLLIGMFATGLLFAFFPAALPLFMLNTIHFVANGFISVYSATALLSGYRSFDY